MQYTLKVFENENHNKFRMIDRNGEPWFVLVDVCGELEIINASDAATRLDADEKDVLDIVDEANHSRRHVIINESGLYSLILSSRKDGAKRFKKWVTSEVLPTIRKTGSYHSGARVPTFIRRYNENWDRIDAGYFSVINELVTRLWGRLEMVGHVMADRAPDGKELRPDVSVGRLFSEWLAKHHPTISNSFTYYIHKAPEWEGEVRQYPNSLLPHFIDFVDTVWIPEHSERYMRKRDPAALPYLPKLLPSPSKPKAGMMRTPSFKRLKKAG